MEFSIINKGEVVNRNSVIACTLDQEGLERLIIRPISSPKFGHIKFPRYLAESERLSSFKNWPIALKQRPKDLSDAGFYYTDKGDRVICFCCGGGLKDWEDDNKPLEEHAKWYGSCDYLQIIQFFRGAEHFNKIINQPENIFQESKNQLCEKNEEENLKICRICYSKEFNTIFDPCGHIVACEECTSRVNACPICRSPFTKSMKIFYP
jgi:baculoviral IAP repeat-containing protein 7/8